ncbi:MAG: tRNA (N(6)-L-threonylcarbamoyladenosine(37)-C(2))-methylthiotransferase MtaB [Candidatus Limivicinus sp.]|jgi:threonylcarbamoyladenosine tRNA methylthiotransferase MtaB
MKYIISTLGCKVNQYETQAVETILNARGHRPAEPGETADAVIVNTCAVTAESGRKSRQAARRLRDENPGAVLTLCGCYSQIEPEEAKKLGAAVVFGSGDRLKLAEALEEAVASGKGTVNIDNPFQRRKMEELPAGALEGRTRAMLKVQDGCANFCTYCIIPYTRGRLRSLPVESAVRETARIDSEGYRELVITGIEMASYGLDLPDKPKLETLIAACAEAAPHMRIRLGSLEPTVVTENFCSLLADSGRICRHFHLSLQSGCDRTLKNMNRKYDTARFFETTELLRKYFPGCGLTCDVICGFPGETEEDHRETLEFIRRCGFSDMHIFPYSRRPGTPADSMPGQCSRALKERRCREARAVCSEMRKEFLEKNVGGVLPVLFETRQGECFTGHSDNYLLVRMKGEKLRGKIIDVKITGLDGETLTGEAQEQGI